MDANDDDNSNQSFPILNRTSYRYLLIIELYLSFLFIAFRILFIGFA